jgi:hypothetical protein
VTRRCRACLAAAVALAALAPPLAPANAASAEAPAPAGASLDFNEEDATLYIEWSGPIVGGMADYLRSALGKYGTPSHRVVLVLNSAGRQVEEGDRVIQILNEIKEAHRLVTEVLDGNLCASMCILQGDDRLAARASHWIFHEAAKPGATGKERTDMTLCLFRRYYVPAGVSMDWLKSIVPIIQHANLSQTGGDLISAKTGIIMCQTAEPNKAARGRSVGGPGRQRSVSNRRSAPLSCAPASTETRRPPLAASGVLSVAFESLRPTIPQPFS